jgi:hypothetical protein
MLYRLPTLFMNTSWRYWYFIWVTLRKNPTNARQTMRVNSKPKLCEVAPAGGGKTKIYCQGTTWLYVGDASLQHYRPSDRVCLRLEIKQTQWGMLIRLHFVSIWSRCSNVRLPTSIQNRRHSRDWRVRSKMPRCCLVVTAASTIREMIYFSESTYDLPRSLDWTGQANGLASQVTGPNTNGLLPIGPH